MRAIGFSEQEDFPIPRTQFAERALPPKRRRDEPEEPETWEVAVKRIRITSPNLEREDQKSRKWKGKTEDGSYLLFEIYDEGFWVEVDRGAIEFGHNTVLQVQIAKSLQQDRKGKNVVVRVLKVDEVRIASELDENALNAILGNLIERPKYDQTLDLFND